MEKKQLNFSAPLMSARRYSSPSRSTCDDPRRVPSIMTLNPLSCQKAYVQFAEPVNPGSVPFMWEKTPGKPKGPNQLDCTIPIELPKLPPGRTSKSGELPGFRNPNKFSGELHTGLVPLNGKVSGEIIKTLTTLNKFHSLNEGMVRWVTSKEEMTEMSATSESRDDGDDDVTFFSNANDSNSQPGSFSVNCSVSGLSASEHNNAKPSIDMISTDGKSRDLMMARFLPAAKAMTLEPPQYASRKPHQQQQQLPVWVPQIPVLKPNMYNVVAYKGQNMGFEKSEEEESSCDDKSIISVKVKACGFLPEIFSKKSLCLLNRLLSLKNRSKSVLSSASSKVSSLAKTSSWKSFSSKSNKTEPCDNHQKQKQNQAFKSCELQKPQRTSRPMFYSGELKTTTRSRSGSPYRSASRRSSSSPYRSVSPRSARPTPPQPQRDNPNEQTRSRTPQKSRIVQVPKSEAAFRYGAPMRTRGGLSGPLVCGANVKDDLAGAVKSGFAPPLPKSPSESWLTRKVSPRRSASNPTSFNSKPHPTGKQSAHDPGSDAKWETIVKSSHLRRDHGWYSGELVTRSIQQPQTTK